MILIDPKNFYYSDQEMPMDLIVLGYSSDNFVGSILRTWCLTGGRCGFYLKAKYFTRWKNYNYFSFFICTICTIFDLLKIV